jgi:hypothetical protein
MKRINPIHAFKKRAKSLSKLARHIKESKAFKNNCCSNIIAFKSIGCNFKRKTVN